MPRKYRRQLGTRKYRDYTDETLQRALEDVVNGRVTLRQAEELYGVPRATINRKYRGVNILKPGRQAVLNDQEENAIVRALDMAAKWGYPFTRIEIKTLVKGYLDRKGIRERRFSENLPGNDWLQLFFKRHHELTVRLSQNMKRSRSEVTSVEINEYFDNLEESLCDVDPSNIINFDETNLTDDPGQAKVVVRRGVKRALRIMDHSKSSTSLMFAITASGGSLPPYIVYKAKNLYSEWMEGGPDNCFYNRSVSGWFDGFIFEDWFTKVILPYFKHRDGKKVVIGDNLASHLSPKIIEQCEKNNIMFIFLPPNSTHVCQPLDVAFFKPLKAAWRKVLTDWKMSNRGCIPKTHFPLLLRQTLENIQEKSADNIKSGFRASGIFPRNRQEVLKRLPGLLPEINNENINPNMEHAFEQIIKRHSTTNNLPPKRKKKLTVGPGKAVTLDHIRTPAMEPLEDDGNHSRSQLNHEHPENPDNNTFSDSDKESLEQFLDDDDEASIIHQPPTVNDLHEGLFVIVKFLYNEGTKKQTSKKFVARIEKLNKKSYTVSCLREWQGSHNTFVYPDVADSTNVDFFQIISILKPPTIRRGRHIFAQNVNLI